MRVVGLLLLAGAALTLGLHLLEAPEALYRWLYHHLLGGLDVPRNPSHATVQAVRDVSLFGGILEVVVGVGLLVADRVRTV